MSTEQNKAVIRRFIESTLNNLDAAQYQTEFKWA